MNPLPSHLARTVLSAASGRGRPITALFFVVRNLGQDRWFDLADCFSFLFFLRRINRLTGGVNQSCRHENDEVALDMLLAVTAEKPANQRTVSYTHLTLPTILRV